MKPTREDIELYVMGAYDGDAAALERAIADDPDASAMLADEAGFEGALREAAAGAKFCVACKDLVRGERCDACGVAIAPGGYTIERVLVSNAHGRMYVARDADAKRVALKELAFVQSPSLATVAAFEREAKFLRALEHPAIPRYLASFHEGEGVHVRYYLAQELVDGDALDARLEDHWYTEAEVTAIAREVLAVLVYLQGLSPMVIHRDIKPANLLRRADGTIAVVDFGAAHVQGSTVGSTAIGTFGYMPVEQLAGLVDATTDLYALGATLLHLLTRVEPWRLMQGGGFDGLNVSKPMRSFLRKLTAPAARDRYQTAGEALAALERMTGTALEPRKPTRVRRPVLWWGTLAAAAVVATGGVGTYVLLDRSGGEYHISGEIIGKMSEFRDRMCECRERTCADRIAQEMTKWGQALAMQAATYPAASDEDTVKLAEVTKQFGDCATHFYANDALKVEPIDVESPAKQFGDPLPAGKTVDLDVKGAPIHDVLRMLAQQCATSLVIPDSVGASITAKLKRVPCDRGLEVLLEAHRLAYTYDASAKLLRVGPRHQLEADQVAARERENAGLVDEELPDPRSVDLDFKDIPIRDALQTLANMGGVNLVIPDSIGGRVTLWGRGVGWIPALRAVLASHQLGYRYRPNGKLLRVGPQRDLDDELIRDCQPSSQVDPFDKRPVCALQGYLHLQASPPARVFVDGADTKLITPIGGRQLPLAPGKHRVTFVIGEDKYTYAVTISANKTETLSKVFE